MRRTKRSMQTTHMLRSASLGTGTEARSAIAHITCVLCSATSLNLRRNSRKSSLWMTSTVICQHTLQVGMLQCTGWPKNSLTSTWHPKVVTEKAIIRTRVLRDRKTTPFCPPPRILLGKLATAMPLRKTLATIPRRTKSLRWVEDEAVTRAGLHPATLAKTVSTMPGISRWGSTRWQIP